jgi:hypothetical protein
MGRVICAIPALERFIIENPDSYIILDGGSEFLLGNPLLQDRMYESSTKGIFENIIKGSELIIPEPYADYEYYNQKINISQAFDKLINGSIREDFDYRPNIMFNKQDDITGKVACLRAKEQFNKEKTIVIQPFGRSSEECTDLNTVIDPMSRSLNLSTFISIAKELSKYYNIISMSEFQIPNNEYTRHPENVPLRTWGSIIQHADYFIGCDSVGQHLAYAVNTPGTVILGSTFAENVTYPNHFNIIEKEGFNKRYSPIRINMFSSFEADQLNDTAMDFNEDETKRLIDNMLADIKAKL